MSLANRDGDLAYRCDGFECDAHAFDAIGQSGWVMIRGSELVGQDGYMPINPSHGRWLVVLMQNSRNDIDRITTLARSNKEMHDRVAVLEKTLRDHGIYP